jgi:hypothetical protein
MDPADPKKVEGTTTADDGTVFGVTWRPGYYLCILGGPVDQVFNLSLDHVPQLITLLQSVHDQASKLPQD